jgi:acyl-CoA reductase-like NAD-dependent aldehyde dehydrogenase
VADDAEALALMNDSRYGLTASIWSRDVAVAKSLGSRLEVGTVFLNRCDFLDPALPWSGWKDSGVGVTLSQLGFARLTRTRGFHLRLPE